jgi:hypothetical protein
MLLTLDRRGSSLFPKGPRIVSKTNDEAQNDEAQKARAKRLREQIQKLKAPAAPKAEGEAEGASPESPREFVHRKMREIEEKKAKG